MNKEQYSEYLNSEKWKAVRTKFFASDQPKECYVCGKPYDYGYHLHHVTYDRVGGEELVTDLVVCCPSHHESIHATQKMEKCSLREATERTRARHRSIPRQELRKVVRDASAISEDIKRNRIIPPMEKVAAVEHRPSKKKDKRKVPVQHNRLKHPDIVDLERKVDALVDTILAMRREQNEFLHKIIDIFDAAMSQVLNR